MPAGSHPSPQRVSLLPVLDYLNSEAIGVDHGIMLKFYGPTTDNFLANGVDIIPHREV